MDGKVVVGELTYDVKVRDRQYYHYKNNPEIDIAIETYSQNGVVQTLGWWIASKANFIIYLWWSDNTKTKFIDGYIIDLPKAREKIIVQHFREVGAKNYNYITYNRIVPIDKFENTIIPIKRDYNQFLKQFFS